VLAKKTDQILFVKVENDGYDLGAQRRVIEKNDLPAALHLMQAWQQAVVEKGGEGFDVNQHPEITALLVEKLKLAENGEYALTGERYREIKRLSNKNWELVELEKVIVFNPKKSEVSSYPNDLEVTFLPMEDLNENRMYFQPKKIRTIAEVLKGYTYFYENDVLLAKVTPCFENGKSGIAKKLKNKIGFGSSEYFVLRAQEKILPEYLYLFISEKKFKELGKLSMTGTGGLQRVSPDFVKKYRIPLPPLEIQREIVAEIEGYHRIIDGARMVVENWKPNIELELEEARKEAGVEEWEMVKLGEVCEFSYGKPLKAENRITGEFPVYGSNGIVGYHNDYLVKAPFIVVGRKGSAGEVTFSEKNGYPIDTTFFIKLDHEKRINLGFLYYLLKTLNLGKINIQSGVPGLNRNDAYKIPIPLPPLEIQKQIIRKIEDEKNIVDLNNELILNYEEKIKKTIDIIWAK